MPTALSTPGAVRLAPRVYVVILNWKGWRDTLLCLESVARLDHPDVRVALCDNGSGDDSMAHFRDWIAGRMAVDFTTTPLGNELRRSVARPTAWVEYDRRAAEAGGDAVDDGGWVLIQTGANLGFAGGCNVGVRYALARGDADFVWLLNNDTVVAADALTQMLAVAQRTDRIGIVGSTLRFYADPAHVQALGGGTFSPLRAMSRHIGEGVCALDLDAVIVARAEQQMAYVVGASMLVSRAFLGEVGLMQEDYFLYFEELDWAERARRAQPPFTLAYAAGSHVFHKVGASAGTAVRSTLSHRYLTVNRLRFVKRFYAPYLPVARLSLLWEALKAAVKGRRADAGVLARAALSPVRA